MSDHALRPIEMWGGIECTLNRVGDEWRDQVERTGHGDREGDLERFAGLGIRALRYPVLWERIAPQTLDRPDWRWTDGRLAGLRALGIRPIAGLVHHGSGPAYTSLIDPHFPHLLADFAGQVAARYPWLADYTPVNEPLTTARFSGLYGLWYPHHRDDRSFVRALLNQVRGTVLAMQAIRRVNPDARLIQTEDCGACFGTNVTARQVKFENCRRWLTLDLLTGRVDAHHPLAPYLRKHGATDSELEFFRQNATSPDVVGLNYYLTSDRYLDHRLRRYPPATHGGNGKIRYADLEAVRVRDEGVVGHEAHLLAAWRRYRLPVAITEVHLSCTRDEQIRWLVEAWRGAAAARRKGAHVVAVSPWALLGSYDWDSLVTLPRGHYEAGAFDVRSQPPRATKTAAVIRELAYGLDASHPALTADGWWRRPSRLIGASTPDNARVTSPGAPILVLGGRGTLARAFHRICELRALPVCCVGRPELNIGDTESLAALIERLQPWAVVNATGYVRVDDAEQDSDTCFGVNTIGAVSVARACQQHGVPLVSFSSDLVFDGALGKPYTEHDTPRPLNVYGASKAEAEWRIREVMPNALVIRTSAFFGPWDAHNFVVQTLRSLQRGQPTRVAHDIVVSPTYVPDLVNTTLDLLIDGETGLWHLANAGMTTWFEFARQAADACGERVDLIEPVPATALGWPATRPAFSALSTVRGTVMRPREEALLAFAEHHEWRAVESVA
ncbi:MAG TPA: dTDP-4-dehydrorhamnose reductase [Vicinamibacterales bacterium]|nr:dTDP-4-dehydrorhamnose reductase [Vicinamibacterales bacterium]